MKIKRNIILFIAMIVSVAMISSLTVLAEPTGSLLLDDYNRPSLGVEGNGGAYNSPNSKGITIYWIQMANTVAKVENNALKIEMKAKGWFGEGGMIKDPEYKYLVMRIKGESGGEEKALSINPDAKGAVNFTALKGVDGNPVPAITKDYQNIVIDIAKSGINLPKGFEAMHFNNTDAITIYIDEIYLSKDGSVVDSLNTSDNNPTTQKGNDSTNTQQESTVSNQTNTEDKNKEEVINGWIGAMSNKSESKPVMLISIISVIAVVAIGGVIYLFLIRKDKK
jgi:hypothetical protein